MVFSEFKNIANSWPPALNFKSFSRSLEQFFLIVGQNNFGNKISLSSLFQLQQNQSMDKADKFSTEVKMLRSENALLQDDLRRAKVPPIYYVSTYKKRRGRASGLEMSLLLTFNI